MDLRSRTLFDFFMWMLLTVTGTGCLNANIAASETSVNIGQSVDLTCTYIGSATETYVLWFNHTAGEILSLEPNSTVLGTCDLFTVSPTFDTTRISYTCNSASNIYTLKINAFHLGDIGKWSCTFQDPATDPSAAEITLHLKEGSQKNNNLLLLLLIILMLPIPIFVIWICCGCLDCCKCCRMFDHYDEKECCYVTWYCSLKGCCSFFYCRPGSKLGKCFCGHDNEMGHCGGCQSLQKKCRYSWPGFCKSKKMRSCGSCYCSCCVEEIMDKGLDETSVAMTGPSAFYTTTKNKVHPIATKLPPIKGITSGETVELKESKKKKKKKNKDKLDLGKCAKEAAEETANRKSPEDQTVPGKEN